MNNNNQVRVLAKLAYVTFADNIEAKKTALHLALRLARPDLSDEACSTEVEVSYEYTYDQAYQWLSATRIPFLESPNTSLEVSSESSSDEEPELKKYIHDQDKLILNVLNDWRIGGMKRSDAVYTFDVIYSVYIKKSEAKEELFS